MSSIFEVSFEGVYVKVLAEGNKTIGSATRLWTAVVAECKKQGCHNILGISDAESPMPVIDGYQHADLFKSLGIDSRYRIAWVEQNPDALDATYFVETVLINRGLPGRLFPSTGAAIEWLLSDNTG